MSIQATTLQPRVLSPKRELWLLLTLAGIQFTHILDFMIMMPLGPQFTKIFTITDAQFGMLVSAYTLAAGASGLLAATYLDKFGYAGLRLSADLLHLDACASFGRYLWRSLVSLVANDYCRRRAV
jgi:MFS family permease